MTVTATTPLKRLADIAGRVGWHGLSTGDYRTEGDYLVGGTDFVNGAVDWRGCNRVSRYIWARDPRIQLVAGDLLVTKDGTIGKVALVSDLPSRGTLNSGIFRIQPTPALSPRFAYWVLRSRLFTDWVDLISSGSTIKHLYEADLREFRVPTAPLEKQWAIADYLDRETARIDALITAKQGMVGLVEERLAVDVRQRLLATVHVMAPLKPGSTVLSGVSVLVTS